MHVILVPCHSFEDAQDETGTRPCVSILCFHPIIQNLVEGVKSDVDDNWHIYKGNREERLKDLSEIIDLFDKMAHK